MFNLKQQMAEDAHWKRAQLIKELKDRVQEIIDAAEWAAEAMEVFLREEAELALALREPKPN